MTRNITGLIFTFLLVGCAQIGTTPSTTITPIQKISSAHVLDDLSYLLWLEQRGQRPLRLRVQLLDQAEQRAEGLYLWREGLLREVEQQGHMDGKLYHLVVRYDTAGDPVYQRYLLNDKVMPLKEIELHKLYQQASDALQLARSTTAEGYELWQGYWTSEGYVDCKGSRYGTEFQVLPSEADLRQWQEKGTVVSLMAKQRRLSGQRVLQHAYVVAAPEQQTECFVSQLSRE
ncbi:DUF1481 domain-containing protein [Thaumasiovibrio sp. DFM-14]|uniref:DUF1481 domain-containing protein n=1 Tax=Thaumasiovibrio sp. DFM-14 TaxID=3384792 RepID=UPI0039A00C84